MCLTECVGGSCDCCECGKAGGRLIYSWQTLARLFSFKLLLDLLTSQDTDLGLNFDYCDDDKTVRTSPNISILTR